MKCSPSPIQKLLHAGCKHILVATSSWASDASTNDRYSLLMYESELLK